MRFLILGSKEYPVHSSRGQDELPPGGFEVYAAALAESLAEKRHEVTIITRAFKGLPKKEEAGGVRVVRVRWVAGGLRNPSLNFFAFLAALREEFDVVVAQGFVAIFFACLLGFLKRRKVIACPAGICWVQPQYNAFSRLFFRLTESVVYRLPKRVVFFSEEEKKQFLTKMGFLPRNYSVIPTGVKIKKTRVADGEKLRAELGLRRKKVVLFAGRLLEVKGVEYLIKAMKGIKATLVVVGDGPLRKELEMLSGKEGVDALFVGWRSDVERFLSIADVFVLPSLSEGLPLVLLEAMAAGKPCIVTDIGLPVTKNFDALAVPPKNAAALREALRRLLNNKTLAKKLGENARKTAEKFSWERAASQYVELAAK